MAKTLLNTVNEVLKRAKLIQGDSGALTSLTDSQRQTWVDSIVAVTNETIDDLYNQSGLMKPDIIGESTITLVTSDRDYSFTGDILYFPLVDETNGRYIDEYPGGYEQIIKDQPIPGNFTGLPLAGAISPVAGELYLDRLPTASENGLAYKYRYQKDAVLSAASDTVPFGDKVWRALIPAITEKFLYYDRKEFAGELFVRSMSTALRIVTKRPPKEFYGPSRRNVDLTGIAFPFED